MIESSNRGPVGQISGVAGDGESRNAQEELAVAVERVEMAIAMQNHDVAERPRPE